MRFCSFSHGSQNRFGFELHQGKIVDLLEAGRALAARGEFSSSENELFDSPDLRAWLAPGRIALELAQRILELLREGSEVAKLAVYDREMIRLLPPIPNPEKIIGIGLNYRDHAQEQNLPLPPNPLIFAKFPSSLIGAEDEIRLPTISQKVDPEAELCVVMLESGKELSPQRARQAIAGYTIGNDVSARDLQFSDKQWVRGKSCDTFAPCGPFLVTEDEIGDPHQLDIELRVNGKVQQSSNTENQIFDCYTLVSYISQTITLHTGDLIFTGTPGGVGVFRKPPVFLKAGDLVEVSIERIGTLRNRVSNST
ncbi:MAG: fumarylacetoacetate hydrolase family protein [Acidobacteria bacterium]|nr:fumarylacetoacetate hydrolase family protein [Acidobacteriota bacterium]MCZ6879299.1 fumarylacetoacetate hydrolase family protein [Acidobacteriota bacterium]